MRLARRRTTIRDRSEEAGALVGVILALTAASATMIALFQAAAVGSVPLIAVPATAVVAALALGRERAALWAGVAAWTVIAPLAAGIGIVAPLLMIVLCATLALGAERVLDWMARDWSGVAADPDPIATGWIEDDPRVR